MQWSGRWARGAIEAIHLRSGLEGAGVDGDDGIQRRPAIVVGLDAIEVVTHHLHTGDLAAVNRGVNAANGGFVQQ